MNASSVEGETALIVGGGPGISASCARLFSKQGMKVAIAARNPDKPVLIELAKSDDISLYTCDASDPEAVERLFDKVTEELGAPRLVVHNIDGRMQGIFRKGVTEVEPDMVKSVLENSAYSAFLVSRSAAKVVLLRWHVTPKQDLHKVLVENLCHKVFILLTYQLMLQLAGHRKMGHASIGLLVPLKMTIWQTLITLRSCIYNSINNIGQPGRSK